MSSFSGSPQVLKGAIIGLDRPNSLASMWTRFNFFLVLESGLSAALWVWFKDTAESVDKACVLTWVGIVSSVCWYAFGAQDRYLVEVYRNHVDDAGAKIAEILRLRDYLGSAYVVVGDQK